ncbi:MAG TPA: DnaB-like helicase C-terminal domain-containing protein [Urbifossiella sp.]|nr:DnaB-like helicase C-terminal domain-containing protein [Urbifossiella sp.]
MESLYGESDFVGPLGAHARRVRDLFKRRALIHAHRASLRDAEDGVASADELTAAAEQRLFNISSQEEGAAKLVPLSNLVRDALAAIDARLSGDGPPPGIETGYADLDEVLVGLRPGQLVAVGGRPSTHKTNLTTNIAVNAAAAGNPTVFLSLEMSSAEIAERLLAMGSGVPVKAFTGRTRLRDADAGRLAAVAGPDGLGQLPLHVYAGGDLTAAAVGSLLRVAIRKHGARLAVVDYLQLMQPENPKENRTLQVGLLTKRLKQLAQQLQIPIILLAQLNRESEKRTDPRPRLSDFRESGEIEAHADVALLTHIPPDQPDEQPVHDLEVIVAKNRNGKRDVIATLALTRSTFAIENKAVGYPR